MIQWIAQALARLCIAVAGLPAVSLECRRAEAAKEARRNVTLAIGYRDTDGDDAPSGGESIDARGFGFAGYSEPDDDDASDRGQR